MNYKLIALTLVQAIRELAVQHVEIEESLGGFANIKNEFLRGQLMGQQDVLLVLAELTSQAVPQVDKDFYLSSTKLRS